MWPVSLRAPVNHLSWHAHQVQCWDKALQHNPFCQKTSLWNLCLCVWMGGTLYTAFIMKTLCSPFTKCVWPIQEDSSRTREFLFATCLAETFLRVFTKIRWAVFEILKNQADIRDQKQKFLSVDILFTAYKENIHKFWPRNCWAGELTTDLSHCRPAISRSSGDLSDSRRPIIYCSMAQLALQQTSGYPMQMLPNETDGKYQQALSNCGW